MYESFYGFRERPFELTPNPHFLVLTDMHREALSNLEYGIARRTGLTLLLGDAGTGKTTVIRAALKRLPTRVHCVHLKNPALTHDEFVAMLSARFGLSDDARASKTRMLLELEDLLQRRNVAGESTVLVVDEVQGLPLELLEEVRLLINIEKDDEKLLSVVFAGQPEFGERLNDVRLLQLKQRIALRCHLRPLTPIETAAYLVGRIRVAGGTPNKTFSQDAVKLIHQYSGGIPRTISVIADNALLTGFAMGERPVVSATVRDVCRDFDLDPHPDSSALPATADEQPVTTKTPGTRKPSIADTSGAGAQVVHTATAPSSVLGRLLFR